MAWSRRPENAGEVAAACSYWVPGTGCVPCLRRHHPVLSPPRGTTGSRSSASAGKAPSEVRAKPPARLEIAPRPPGAPPPVRAPPHGGKRLPGWRGKEGGNLFPDRSALPELMGATPTRALRLPRPHWPRAPKEMPLGAVVRPRGVGRDWRRLRPARGSPVLDSGLPLGSTPQLLSCHCPGGGTE